ncbi:hypothetical protein B7R54_10605 [Subtercola boreus]|uniref:Uncharacterized protein n=1 Tax=Subtercola boreus TaxID=120213 RepID=A0A3E0VIY9_9MICO|nr:hypothetical protein [Subtercola boreus]RFA09619.1 hypothetical protein B7R54_10605 [Subtercola boreus]TQL53307.1 hypothetical protein FB464_0805 [Subtercola boreus]
MRYGRRQALVLGAGILLAAGALSVVGSAAQPGAGARAVDDSTPASLASTSTAAVTAAVSTGAASTAAASDPADCAIVPPYDGPDAATRTSGPLIPECQVLGDAPAAETTAPSRARLMTLGEADELLSTGVIGIVPSSTPVWVLTVHAPMATFGSPLTAPVTFPVYSYVFNAHTGWTYTFGIGSNALG